jgi:hypothetical protein
MTIYGSQSISLPRCSILWTTGSLGTGGSSSLPETLTMKSFWLLRNGPPATSFMTASPIKNMPRLGFLGNAGSRWTKSSSCKNQPRLSFPESVSAACRRHRGVVQRWFQGTSHGRMLMAAGEGRGAGAERHPSAPGVGRQVTPDRGVHCEVALVQVSDPSICRRIAVPQARPDGWNRDPRVRPTKYFSIRAWTATA